MKKICLAVCLCISATAFAQKNSSTTQHVNDDGNKLSMKITGSVNGKKINYDRTFDVTGWSDEEREALKQRVYDSLGVPKPVVPVAPIPPNPPELTLTAPAVLSSVAVELKEPVAPVSPVIELKESVPAAPGAPVVYSKSEFSETYAIGGDNPYTKEIKYNPKSGMLYMKYRFVKNGEEVTYEKSVEARNASKTERSDIITKYEKEIGLRK